MPNEEALAVLMPSHLYLSQMEPALSEAHLEGVCRSTYYQANLHPVPEYLILENSLPFIVQVKSSFWSYEPESRHFDSGRALG